MKNTNPNTILSKNKCNKVLKNKKSLGFLHYESDPDMTYSFANKANKIAKSRKYDVGLSSSVYISVQVKTMLR